jgi:hypothetical protein
MSEHQNWSVWFQNNLTDMWELFQNLIQKPVGEPNWTIDNWKPSANDKAFAWDMFVELRTRISTQPLHLHFLSGDEATALDSLFRLFQIVRDLEKKHGVGGFVSASLTSFVLNSDIRPVTARWHKMKLEGKLHPEDLRREFRANLLKLQPKLRAFQKLLLRIVGGNHYDGSDAESEKVSKQETQSLEANFPYDRLLGYDCTCQVSPTQITEIVAAETREIQNRRDAVKQVDTIFGPCGRPSEHLSKLVEALNSSQHGEGNRDSCLPVNNVVGLAISGGGIRSATFALGVVQGLTQRGIFKQVDIVSTVSGGGYLGSFLSTYLNNVEPDCGPIIDKAPFRPEVAEDSRAIRSLRNNSRYIEPSSFLRWLTTVGQVAYGIASNLILLSLWVFVAVLLTKLCAHDLIAQVYSEAIAKPPASNHGNDWSLNIYSKGCLIFSGVMLFFLPTVQRLRQWWGRSFSKAGCYEIITPFAFLLTGGIILLNLTPNFHYLYYRFMRWIGDSYLNAGSDPSGWSLTATFVAVSNAIGLLIARGNWLKELAKSFPILGKGIFLLLWMCGPVLFGYAYFELCRVYVAPGDVFVSFGESQFPADRFILGLAIGSFLYSMAVNVNFTSLHRFYRNRLSDTYLLEHSDLHKPKPVVRQLLSKMRQEKTSTAPYHLLNAALNLPSSKVDDLRGRNSDFFLFSKHVCGSPVIGYSDTTKWEDSDGHLDLATAMAISGAAAAPQMGMGTIKGASFLMTLLNVRMAYWLRRPYDKECGIPIRKALTGPGPLYLCKEAMNWMSEKSPYLNVSDGGHLENLAIYELLRRRCKFIIAIDGEHDPELTFPSLRQLQRFAEVDLGVKVEINVERIEWSLPSIFQPSDKGEHLIKDKAAEREKPEPIIQRFSRGHFAVGKIKYPDIEVKGEDGKTTKAEITGWLLYVKLSVTGNEADYVHDYRRQHPDFPHQTTNDQIFEEAQFEAYRALGEHVSGDLFADEIVANCPQAKTAPDQSFEVHDWFQGLATTMLRRLPPTEAI